MRISELQARLALFASAVAAVFCGYHVLLLSHAAMVFNDPKEDMSFGWYVPLFSLYILWRERASLREALGRPSAWGALATLPFLACGLLGVRGIQVRFEILGFAGLLWTLSWAFFGWRLAKRTWFPAAFLLFCLPLATYLDVVTVHLRLFATSTAYGVLKGCGVDIVRRGTMIFSPDGAFSIDVADPCSGLRSLFALMALTAGYAYFSQRTWFRRAFLFALSVPIAVFGNVMRILTIVLAGMTCSPDFATGFYHDYSGYVVFIVAIGLMLAASGLIARIPAFGKAAPASAPPEPSRSFAPSFAVLPVAVFVSAVMCWQARTPETTLAAAPTVALGEIDGFRSETFEPSEAELEVLPADTTFVNRVYENDSGTWFRVTAVIGGRSKSSIHRPELCLPAQGFQMLAPRDRDVAGVDWRFITLGRGAAAPLGFAYTFFNQEGYATSSHLKRIFRDVWDRSLYNRIDRWVMVTVNASTADDAALSAFLSELKGTMPCLNR